MIQVTKKDGRREPFDSTKLARILEKAAGDWPHLDTNQILMDIELLIYDGMPVKEIWEALLQAVVQNIQFDPDYSRLAARLMLHGDCYRRTLGKSSLGDPAGAHRALFADRLQEAAAKGLLDGEMLQKFDLHALAHAINIERDELWDYTGLFTLCDRYLIKDIEANHWLETPQMFWMRVAMGVSRLEDNPTERAIAFYNKMSQLHYVPSTPTLFNSGTRFSQLSSCFLMEMQDDLPNIGKSLCDIMQLEKYAGGIGISITKLRSAGSLIKSINGKSSGPIPFIKMIDAVVAGVSQGGRRRGSLAIYCEPWHLDIEKYLALKQRAGDDQLRAHTINTVLWLNDEFLRRAEANEDWYLFDPRDVPDLPELYGAAFTKRYGEYIEMARHGKLRNHRVMKAYQLYEKMLKNLQETSHPWLTFKDPGNVRCPIKNAGIVHSSNLCTEIFLPTDRDHTAVCNLTSINLSRHLDENGEILWDRLAESTRLAIRQLDNVIDTNFYATPEAERANKETRPVGLGIMGLADMLERKGMAFDAKEAQDLWDRIVEFISWHTIDASCDLAKERSPFPQFEGSDWSKGRVPIDTLADLETQRGQPIDVDKSTKMDWDKLRARVQEGIRNGTTMAIAPTATISLIAATSQCIEPNFSNVFSRNNLSGKFLEVNRNLVAELKKLGTWDDLREEIMVKRGDIAGIPAIPDRIREVYRSAYSMNPTAFVEIAARAQKYVDMGISRNMYLATKNPEALAQTYLTAWRKGLKSTYYAFFKTAMHAEASYASDESRVRPEWAGKGSAAPEKSTVTSEPKACSLDDPTCESCQ